MTKDLKIQAKVENFHDTGMEHFKDVRVRKNNLQFYANNCFSFQYITYYELRKEIGTLSSKSGTRNGNILAVILKSSIGTYLIYQNS